MKKLILILLIIFAVQLNAQTVLTLKRAQWVPLYENIQLVDMLTKMKQTITAFDGKTVIFIPTEVNALPGRLIITNNHFCMYRYNAAADRVTYIPVVTIGYEIDFVNKTVEEKTLLNNDSDVFKPGDLEERIKRKEKKDKTEKY